MVLVTMRYQDLPFPRVGVDREAAGRMAARYYLDRGFRHLAYLGEDEHPGNDRRLTGFSAEIAAEDLPAPRYFAMQAFTSTAPFVLDRGTLDFLRRGPKPLAVLAARDDLAGVFLAVCQGLGLVVPAAVVVMGMDDYAAFCEACAPKLSSVATNGARVGYEGMALLLEAVQGSTPGPVRRLVPPIGVVARSSTDAFAVEDELVRRALEQIWQHHGCKVRIKELAAALYTNRRTLELRFRRCLNRSPYDLALALRLVKAQQLLAGADWTAARIARETGFHDAPHFSTLFKKKTGLTPLTWRRRGGVPHTPPG